MNGAAVGWNHPATARYYRSFDRKHPRYRIANQALASRAELRSSQRVLDLGAGIGGTAREVLARIGADGRIVCFEPAAAMRALGRKTLRDPRVRWASSWPRKPEVFDRILCGAALWQMRPLENVFRRCFALLRPRGAFAFTVPSLYLGEPDPPGGGRDPHLVELPARLAAGRVNRATLLPSPLDAPRVDALLRDAGFVTLSWTFSLPFPQPAYRDWLKIPPSTDGILIGMDPRRRAAAIDRAYRRVDATSWREERWSGWTAWKI